MGHGDHGTIKSVHKYQALSVVDLAKGSVKALRVLLKQLGRVTLNLVTGRGYSVLEIVKASEKAIGKSVAYEIVACRPGDVSQC